MLNVVQNQISKFLVVSLFSLPLLNGASSHARVVQGVCDGRALPSDKTRGLARLRLECSVSQETVRRAFVPFSNPDWDEKQESLLYADPSTQLEIKQEMQALRQEESTPEFKGSVPYDVEEVWDWQEKVYGQHVSCGFKTVHKGALDSSQTQMRSCWHYETKTERRHCSSETLGFRIEYLRPSRSEWNPSHPEYLDVLPSKYDLFPGEFENLQVSTNWLLPSTNVHPDLKIKDARNKYKIHNLSPKSLPCRPRTSLEAHFQVVTEKRNVNKASPNSFILPIDETGKSGDAIEWLTGVNENGEVVRTRPDRILLQDQAATLWESLAKETRMNEGGSWKAFFKNTIIRIRLVQRGFNLWRSRRLYLSANHLSRDEKNQYVLPLNDQENPLFTQKSGTWGRIKNWFKVSLKKKKRYTLYVSVYQKDMPLFAQACSESSSFFCKLFNWESKYYSPELAIDFETDEKFDYKSLMKQILLVQ